MLQVLLKNVFFEIIPLLYNKMSGINEFHKSILYGNFEKSIFRAIVIGILAKQGE